MDDQPSGPVATTLAGVATELARQAQELKKLASTAESKPLRSRTKRAGDTATDDRLAQQQRDLQLLREQVEDLAAQAWALQWRYDDQAGQAGQARQARQARQAGATGDSSSLSASALPRDRDERR